jgi:hypothetical protein
MRGARWLVLGAIGTTLIAGCGGGGSTSSGHGASTSVATTSAATTGSTPAKTSSTPSGVAANPVELEQAVAVCKSIIERATTLSAATKAKVESICNKAEHGDLTGARAAAREVCAEVIDASPIPAAAKAQALAACKRSS